MEIFNDNNFPSIKFENDKVQEILNQISLNIENRQRNDFELICQIQSLYNFGDMHQLEYLIYCRFNTNEKYYNIFELLEKYFGFKRKTVEKILYIADKFIDWSDVAPKYVVEEFKYFTLSKIKEFLSLTVEQIRKGFQDKILTFKSTVKEIRAYVKFVKCEEKTKVVEINEDDIPMAFDINQKYELSYFQSLSKNQLINICWEYQNKLMKNKIKKD